MYYWIAIVQFHLSELSECIFYFYFFSSYFLQSLIQKVSALLAVLDRLEQVVVK